jgi:hypothetical protein
MFLQKEYWKSLVVEKNGGGQPQPLPFKGGLAGCGKTVVARTAGGQVDLVHLVCFVHLVSRLLTNYVIALRPCAHERRQTLSKFFAGCSERRSSKAAASEDRRRTLWGTLRI